ncbi:hypothetical protein JG687_00016253, partial [Phytophthora cactorum]
DLPFAPHFINVRLADRGGSPLSQALWPSDLNLNCFLVNGTDARDDDAVIIPIGYVLSNKDHCSISVTDAAGSAQDIKYSQHTVDLAMILTVWKAQ